MGTRIKTFDSTGTAPNGRLYAGDLNAMQDQYADLSNLSQTLGVGSIQVGETGLQLLRFGAGEARISGALRTDGILRGLGGLFAGTFTTTARNAISSPPFGLIILNTTTNQFEWNSGTPSVPVWTAIAPPPAAAIPTGIISPYGGVAAPAGWVACDGSAISRTTFSALFTAIGTTWGPGDGSSTFNVPDLRGRVAVGIGSHSDVSTLAANEGVALASRRPKHKHSITDPGHTHTVPRTAGNGASAPSGGIGGNTDGVSGSSTTGITVGPQSGSEPTDAPAYAVVNYIIKT